MIAQSRTQCWPTVGGETLPLETIRLEETGTRYQLYLIKINSDTNCVHAGLHQANFFLTNGRVVTPSRSPRGVMTAQKDWKVSSISHNF